MKYKISDINVHKDESYLYTYYKRQHYCDTYNVIYNKYITVYFFVCIYISLFFFFFFFYLYVYFLYLSINMSWKFIYGSVSLHKFNHYFFRFLNISIFIYIITIWISVNFPLTLHNTSRYISIHCLFNQSSYNII